jgi:gliding motility-associated protein GldM
MKKIITLLIFSILIFASCTDKKVINAFGYMNEKLEESNQVLAVRNEIFQQVLNSKINEDPKKYKSIKERADKVELIANDFYNYLEDLKDTIYSAHFKQGEDRSDYIKLSKSNYLDNLFFLKDKPSQDGQKFLDKVSQFKVNIANALGRGFASISSLVNARFRIDDIQGKNDKVTPWLNLKFKGFPAITSITNLSQMQTDIQLIQSELLSSMISGEFERELALRNFVGIVQLNKNAYLEGELVKGKILLGRFDTSVTPENVIVNGVKVNEKFLREGEISLNFRAKSIGEHPLAGVFTITEEGEPVKIRFSSSYSVIRKYRYEGSDPSKPNATGQPVSNVPETPAFDETKVRLAGSIRGQFGYLRLSKRTLNVSTIGAVHFDSNTKYKAVSFSINFNGKRKIKVRGNKLDARAKKLVSKLKKGHRVKIFDIKVVSSTGGRLNDIEPINIKIKN